MCGCGTPLSTCCAACSTTSAERSMSMPSDDAATVQPLADARAGDRPMRVTLLGPQRRPTLDQAIKGLDPGATFATVTAGWQEREPDDMELDALLGGRTANLNLYRRWLEIQEHDPEFASAELEHRTYLEELRLLYLVQLESAVGTIDLLAKRNGDRPEAIDAAMTDAHAVVRLLDEGHV